MTHEAFSTLLRIDSSASHRHSITRRLGNAVEERLQRGHPDMTVRRRDLGSGIEFVDEHWVDANLAAPEARTVEQRARLADSDKLVRELDSADAILLTVPVYNFSIPATLKAWIDQVCRARQSFRYTDNGPVGLLKDRPLYLVMASGGVAFGSPADFASDYLRHIFSFIGIHDVRPVLAERTNADAAASESAALQMLGHWLPETTAPAVA